jgi:hypothetical protein
MQARKLSVRVEADEAVAVVYARDLEAMPDALFLRVGELHLTGRPAHVVAALESALHECLKAWASGYADEAGGDQSDAARYGNAGLRPASMPDEVAFSVPFAQEPDSRWPKRGESIAGDGDGGVA